MAKKALAAMSGGVDSSVAAFLLQQGGFECVGVTMKLFSGSSSSCCALSDVNDAKDAARRLGIPHYVCNFSDAFRDLVIRPFIETYQSGGTPNPCIDCNRHIKFGRLLFRMKQLDFEYLATGHYARLERSSGRVLLKKARDAKKDQSYVLYTMTQDQLAHTLFPLGDLTKEEVRGLAREQGLANARKQDSQDICFVDNRDYAGFIEGYTGAKAAPGDIIDERGNKLGTHKGLIRYTIGQRRGLGLSYGTPRYVSAKSAAGNTVTLGEERSLYTAALTAEGLNFISCSGLDRPIRVKAKTRYLQTEQEAVAEQTGPDRLLVTFDRPQRAVTAGQAVVLYDGDLVIGGGTIQQP
ncbi:MAG: tRNA 2-thiouridine(34) synthase MnmA [Spirochaetaceae bacterium]|jgi:tRNA-specific 2-thiouridylase|nr:tRNA 2-thiouridine(34) synthase MnmA [Spirochaetaceae bacterium]